MGNAFTLTRSSRRMSATVEANSVAAELPAQQGIPLPDVRVVEGMDRTNIILQAADLNHEVPVKLNPQQLKLCSKALSRLRKVFPNREKIAREFLEIDLSESPRLDPSRITVGIHPVNIPKNRYRDILPFDETRVVLHQSLDSNSKPHGEGDYINANFIKDSDDDLPTFIATQGPLQNTVHDFWQMIIQYRCPVIVMLTQLVDEYKTEKCADYLPKEGVCRIFGNISVTNRGLRNSIKNSVASRLLEVNYVESENPPLLVLHLQYLNWPDHGVPYSTNPVRQLIKKLYMVPAKMGPFVVHCSAGVGRTGTFCTIFHTIYRILKGDLSAVDLSETVRKYRKQRIGMVQNQEQFYFCYDSVVNELEDLISQQK